MKKMFLAVLILTAILAMAACRSDNNGSDNNVTTPTQGINNDLPTVTPDEPRDPVTIRYANWNLGPEEENNIERRMLQAFMDAHDWITVEIDDSITGNWTEALALAAATGALPDVFMINDIPQNIISGWLMDITDMSMADPEFLRVPNAVRDAVTFGGRVYAVPFAQFMIGFYVNRDLFNALNLNPPTFGISPEDFFQAVRNTTDLNRPSVGVGQLFNMLEWYPGAMNPNLGHFTFDGTGYNIASPEMIEGMRIAQELTTGGFTWNGLTETQREPFEADNDWLGFRTGEIAFSWDGTWSNENLSEIAEFDWDFISIPGGRPLVTIDITGIAATSNSSYEAYLLAKWMGHGDLGFSRRLQIAGDMGILVGTLPFTNNSEILNRYWEGMNIPGLIAAYAQLDNALIDGNKIVPGYAASRWGVHTGLAISHEDNVTANQAIEFSIQGFANFADIAAQVNTVINTSATVFREELEIALGN